jgi:hypothetical protein
MGFRNTATSVARMTRFLKDPMVGPILTELVTEESRPDEFNFVGRIDGQHVRYNVFRLGDSAVQVQST